jgi:SAM-dependent methyltransferase
MHTMKVLLSQQGWIQSYNAVQPSECSSNDPIAAFLQQNLRGDNQSKKAIELGCYPGRYLLELGRLGFSVSGIDVEPKAKLLLPGWLKRNNVAVDDIYEGDCTNMFTEQKFDLVCSFGLIEHFTPIEPILDIHLRLVSDGGILVITVPNFAGTLQRLFHTACDRQNLSEHNLAAMSPQRWFSSRQALEVLFCGPIGRWDFWVGAGRRSILERCLAWSVCRTRPMVSRILSRPRYAWSPYCGAIVRKRLLSE